MVSQADRELINNFVNELRPYLETVESGVQEFAQPHRDGVVVGQAVQALMMVRGAGQILMVDGLVSISSWLVESLEKIQNNPDISPAEATRRLTGLFSAMEDFLNALDRGEDADGIVLRARTIFEAIPAYGGPLPGTGKLRPRTDLDALFGDEQSKAPTDRIGGKEAADTEKLAARALDRANDQTAEIPDALPTVPLQRSDAATRRVTDQPARIVPVPPQPTEELPDVDPELREIFEEEALDIIAAFGDGIRELARNPSDQQAIRNLNRAAHTLKGAANMTGFPLIAQIGAAIEHLFDAHLEHGMTVSRDVLELVAVSWKMLRAMMPKLNNLSSFTSPSNSIVQRANVLREELAQALAEAETISIDQQHYEEPVQEPAAQYEEAAADKPTDEIVSINIQMPASTYQYVEVDAMMVEAAPTVPLNREAVESAPVVPQPADDVPVADEPEVAEADDAPAETLQTDAAPTNEIAEPVIEEPVPAEDGDVDADASTGENVVEPDSPSPFWGTDEALAEPEETPQSEPFWTPGTEELMRSAVHTDRLIADLYDIPDFDDEIVEEAPEDEASEFFTAVDEDETTVTDEVEADDASWLEESDRPGTDLLNFDSTPHTEPFWGDLESPEPAAFESTESDEPVMMDPFFEPVEGGTTFLQASGLAESFTDEPETIDESIFQEDWLANGVDAAAAGEASTARLSAPEAVEVEPERFFVEEAEPLGPSFPTDFFDAPVPDAMEPAEASDEASEEAEIEPDYAYEYAFDFEVTTEPDHEEMMDRTDASDQSPVSEAVAAPRPVVRPAAEIVVVPAFQSDTAEVFASAALEAPHYAFATFEIEDDSAVVEEPAPQFDATHWETLDAVIPTDFVDQRTEHDFVAFNAIDHAEDDDMLAALDARIAESEEQSDVVVPIDEALEVRPDVGDAVGDIDEFDDVLIAHEDFSVEADEEFEEFWTPEPAALEADQIEVAHEDTIVEPALEMDASEPASELDIVDDMEITPFDEHVPAEAFQDTEAFPLIEETPVDQVIEVESDGVIEEAQGDANVDPEVADVAEDLLIEFDEESIFDLDTMEAGDVGTPDWFEEPEAFDSEPDQESVIAGPEPPAVEPESPLPGTGLLRDSGTGMLRGPATDPIGFGSLDLARFMTPEGSMALSSALLDMAFAGQGPSDDFYGDSSTANVSVFDESSDRALEIEMFETFALEAEDHLVTLNRAAMQLDRDPFSHEPLVEIKRALHTLKGAAAAADFESISNLTHRLEDALASQEQLGTLGDRTFTSDLFTAIEEIESRLAQRKDEIFGKSEDEQENPSLRVDISSVDNLLNTVGELVVNRSSFEERLERLEAMIEDLSTAATRLQRSSYMLEREANAEDAIGRLLRGEMNHRDNGFIVSAHNEWDTLEMDRYTEFDRLIRQLAEVGADVATVVGEISSLRGDFETVSTRQRRLTTALQDELMDIRMVPISSLAPRLYRVVRRAAGQRGKDVSLVFEGGDTPFDKILLDTLSESLLHLLRNAVDHGIEDVGERRRIGKPEHGTIRVRAFRDGSEAVIEIIDDGAGIDHYAVIEHAREKGLTVSDGMSREDALSLIFTPGFSTRVEADDISGRGLGLEIVEQTVSRYKGRVAVDSVPGRGTVFSLRLPVMLSVIQAFLVKAGNGDFAIPVANVDYVVDRIDQPLTQIGESVVVETAGQIIPVVDVGMKLGDAQTPVLEKDAGWVMVTEIAGKRWALVVDELYGQQEIVVKPMGRFLRAMPSLMGATILGHGDVALIVDVPALLGADSLVTRLSPAALSGSRAEKNGARTPDLNIRDDGDTRVVLVVDDSLSVRRVVSRTLERHGWVAMLARDGAEALELLEQGPVDVVLTDIEMPRMDGFELISTIRKPRGLWRPAGRRPDLAFRRQAPRTSAGTWRGRIPRQALPGTRTGRCRREDLPCLSSCLDRSPLRRRTRPQSEIGS
ncbi:MAG: Hpt domain-containing protein [Thermomicrobiales bacterium]